MSGFCTRPDAKSCRGSDLRLMDLKFLDFEQPIAELEAKIDELRYVGDDSEININEEVARLKDKSESLTKSIFAKLSPWQVARVARHESRPYTQDYLS